MIVRFHIDPIEQGHYEYRVSYEGEELYGDAGLDSIEDCIVAATEGLGGDAIGAEVAYKGVISGTYALASLALATEQIAVHALQTTEAIEEAFRQD
ncbi:hypothetical protein SAMN05216344_11532 [Polaromonas sp. OV174]|uniref:hypothetical protein n=1 Tax=Polaromonas sp. OV174 TaxID=1855300 RepID=UPI0008F17DC4|nr:hypothetical protein [Polaromonas sp. OV174]SFC36330.1 hypothetical protein SAMN05216344_11532 [Polaromonas sp. OV174]